MFLEEWKMMGSSRIKSVIIVILAVAVLTGWCAQDSTETMTDSVLYQTMDGKEEESESRLIAKEEDSENRLTAKEEEIAYQPEDISAQLQLAQYEQEFHEAMEQLEKENLLIAEYSREAEEKYLEYAEAMSWAVAYYKYANTQNPENGQKVDLLLLKGNQKAALIRQQTDWISDLWVEK